MPSGSFPSSICSTIVGDRDVSCKIRLTCVRSTLFAAAISSMLLYLPDSNWSCQSQALAMLVISGTFSAFGAYPSSAVLPSAKIICRPLSR